MKVQERAIKILNLLSKATNKMQSTLSDGIIKIYGKDPFIILISCLLSLRAKDIVTFPVSLKLFKIAKTPEEILKVPLKDLEKILHSIGFYKQKAKFLRNVSKEIINKYNGKVPRNKKDLLSINGVGPKTANLVLNEAFGIFAICVDTHVHRISNRLGLVNTKTPEETEKKLEKILPKNYWNKINKLFVLWGQNICTPASPFCSKCKIFDLCKRVNVVKHR